MSMAKQKFTEEQDEQIAEGWSLFNAAMEACEEAEGFIHDLGNDIGIDTERACEALASAHAALERVYSYGAPILPNG